MATAYALVTLAYTHTHTTNRHQSRQYGNRRPLCTDIVAIPIDDYRTKSHCSRVQTINYTIYDGQRRPGNAFVDLSMSGVRVAVL